MFTNRISEAFEMAAPTQPTPQHGPLPQPTPLADLLALTAPTWSLYQAAAAQAVRDFELNKLFNPQHYGIDLDDDSEPDWLGGEPQ